MNIKWDFSQMICEFGVDKVHLSTDAYSLTDIENWVHVPNRKKAGAKQAEPMPLVGLNGEMLNGEKLYLNEAFYSAEFKHNRLLVSVNPSKFFDPYRLTADPDRIAHVLTYIQSDLTQKKACECNLFAANLSRVDFAVQNTMNKPVPEYDAVIRSAREYKRAPRTEYPHGWLIANKQRQVCTYDKGLKAVQDTGIKTDTPTNLLRVEARYLNGKTLRANTMFATVNDLLTQPLTAQHYAYSATRSALLQVEQSQIQLSDEADLTALTELLRLAIIQKGKKALDFVLLTACYSGNMKLSAKGLKYAAGQLYAEGLISINTVRNLEKRFSAIMADVKKVAEAFHKTSELNYYANLEEFTAKFIEPYKTAI
jgi:hypothetical protein